jgi:hypothetical protein
MNSRLTAPDSSTPESAMMLAFRPRVLVRPAKNCLPYWTPTAYRKIASPKVPTIGAGLDLGANQPIASATNRTAPAPSEKPLRLTCPTR